MPISGETIRLSRVCRLVRHGLLGSLAWVARAVGSRLVCLCVGLWVGPVERLAVVGASAWNWSGEFRRGVLQCVTGSVLLGVAGR